jgi:uncharacterized protein YecT (DUF1311 family)
MDKSYTATSPFVELPKSIYFAQMPRSRHLRTQRFALTTTILVATCTLAITAVAQAIPADPPTACSAYASIPLPPEAEKVPVPKTSPACASYRSYRGIGRPVNYSAARACAWQERLAQKSNLPQNQPDGTAWIVGGSLILADIYFNGAGVQRNVPLAIRLACESEEGMGGELAPPDIAKLNTPLTPGKPLEFCDYASTTFSETFCADYESEVADDRRTRYFNSLISTMTQEQKAAFEKLLAAEHAYIQAHADEVYQGGSMHGIRTVASMDILNDLFRTDIVHFEHEKWPTLSSTQITQADATLQNEYAEKIQQLQTRTKEEIEDGVVTAAQLSSVQKPWEAYLDAWVAFARQRYPNAVPAIRAEIILDRYRLLKTIS